MKNFQNFLVESFGVKRPNVKNGLKINVGVELYIISSGQNLILLGNLQKLGIARTYN